MKNRKKNGPSKGTSDLLVNKTNLVISFSSSWILDSGSSALLCTYMQDLDEVRGLREDEITLRIGNGARVAAVAIGTYPLRPSLGLSLLLKDCYYVPASNKNLISISVLA